ncbi:hypothetical protein TWF751_009178 [Orbilia oligospora]|nr:hypothetical protein TWF751_009178 [Orbilia oligospora]
MGLWSKLTGKDKQEDFSHLQGSSSSDDKKKRDDFSHLSSDNKGKSSKSEQEYRPVYRPPGEPSNAPPGYDMPPPGPPPPDHFYAPPTQLPPSFDHAGGSSSAPGYQDYGPPIGPPPGYMVYNVQIPPPAVPQRSKKYSQGLNASEDDAEAGHEYCRHNPVARPTHYDPNTLDRIARGEVGLFMPGHFGGHLTPESNRRFEISTHKDTQDATLLSGLPLYSSLGHYPRDKAYKTIYYEIKIKKLHGDSSLAIGYTNVPTPPMRLPGWHRGGLAVHSDDGNRYINDPYGGKEFTHPFNEGETIGLGIRFRMGMAQAFLTRDGREVGNWMIDEPRDWEDTQRLNGDGNITGLMGDNDLYAAIGVFGKLEFDVEFGYNEWQDSTIQH